MVCFYFTFNGVVSLVSLLAVNPLAKQDNLKPISIYVPVSYSLETNLLQGSSNVSF